jgi:hypothetical protein
LVTKPAQPGKTLLNIKETPPLPRADHRVMHAMLGSRLRQRQIAFISTLALNSAL